MERTSKLAENGPGEASSMNTSNAVLTVTQSASDSAAPDNLKNSRTKTNKYTVQKKNVPGGIFMGNN